MVVTEDRFWQQNEALWTLCEHPSFNESPTQNPAGWFIMRFSTSLDSHGKFLRIHLETFILNEFSLFTQLSLGTLLWGKPRLLWSLDLQHRATQKHILQYMQDMKGSFDVSHVLELIPLICLLKCHQHNIHDWDTNLFHDLLYESEMILYCHLNFLMIVL